MILQAVYKGTAWVLRTDCVPSFSMAYVFDLPFLESPPAAAFIRLRTFRHSSFVLRYDIDVVVAQTVVRRRTFRRRSAFSE